MSTAIAAIWTVLAVIGLLSTLFVIAVVIAALVSSRRARPNMVHAKLLSHTTGRLPIGGRDQTPIALMRVCTDVRRGELVTTVVQLVTCPACKRQLRRLQEGGQL